jgi:hypothetical protein
VSRWRSSPAQESRLAEILSFETEHPSGRPGGWGGGPPGTIFADDKIVHGGRWSARIERQTDSASTFSTLTNSIPVDFAGTSIELRGFLRTENVSDFAGLWLREDDESSSVAFDNMQSRQLKGTAAWFCLDCPNFGSFGNETCQASPSFCNVQITSKFGSTS